METYKIDFPETFSVALAVLTNAYGTGQERIDSLKRDGFNPTRVQECVNDLCEIIERYRD